MFLLVTLEKESLGQQFQYQDHFIGSDLFQWQSQNRTAQNSETRLAIKHHRERGVEVHLFVRRDSKIDGRAAPFVYCGQLEFVDWDGEKPITVQWRLLTPLSERLERLFRAP